jgi:predicted PurR-regulated permease PerM
LNVEGLLMDINKNRIPITAILLTAILALATAYYFWPLAEGIIFGTFFFFVTRPIKEFLGRYTKYSPYLAAFCILLPFIALIAYGVFGVWDDVQWAVQHSSELSGIIKQFAGSLGLPFDTNGAIDQAVNGAYDGAVAFLKGLPIRSTFSSFISLVMNALISLFVCFYLLKDGGSFVKSLQDLAPARQRHILDMFLMEADRLLSGIYIGTFYTALFVAAGSLILFMVFGIPYKALFTAFVFIAAMVPILSGMMVFLPLTAYIFIYRSPLIAALFLGTAVIFVYLPPDFIIRPYLINKASDLHPLLIILAFIGGGVAGGLSGFFAAPLVVGLLTAAYRTYKKTKGNENESIP